MFATTGPTVHYRLEVVVPALQYRQQGGEGERVNLAVRRTAFKTLDKTDLSRSGGGCLQSWDNVAIILQG